jgi:long-subunit acyl-CoA synthetase (AMP-forming)
LLGIANPRIFYQKMKMTTLWYKDGELNICYLALDQHIQDGHGDQIAFVYDVTQTVKKYSYAEVKPVAKLAGGMQSLGLKGDTAIIYMPMIPQAAFRHARLCTNRCYTFSCFGGLLHMNLLLE